MGFNPAVERVCLTVLGQYDKTAPAPVLLNFSQLPYSSTLVANRIYLNLGMSDRKHSTADHRNEQMTCPAERSGLRSEGPAPHQSVELSSRGVLFRAIRFDEPCVYLISLFFYGSDTRLTSISILVELCAESSRSDCSRDLSLSRLSTLKLRAERVRGLSTGNSLRSLALEPEALSSSPPPSHHL